jgi:hypothetical protein
MPLGVTKKRLIFAQMIFLENSPPKLKMLIIELATYEKLYCPMVGTINSFFLQVVSLILNNYDKYQ